MYFLRFANDCLGDLAEVNPVPLVANRLNNEIVFDWTGILRNTHFDMK